MTTDLPWPIDAGSTHWEGCYRERRHHNCAVVEVDRLRAENLRMRKALRRIADAPSLSGVTVLYLKIIARAALETTDDD